MPLPNDVDMSVIQEAINRRRTGGVTPALEQRTGGEAGPAQGAPPTPTPAPAGGPDMQALLAQRAGSGAPPTEGGPAPAGGEESPDETRILAKLLIEKLRKLL